MFEVFKVCFKVDSINAKCLMTKTLIPTDVSDVAGATEQFHECAMFNASHFISVKSTVQWQSIFACQLLMLPNH